MKRRPMPKKKGQRLFTRTAKKVHKGNGYRPMRGGIRF